MSQSSAGLELLIVALFIFMFILGLFGSVTAVGDKEDNADNAWEGLGRGSYELRFYRQSGNTHAVWNVYGGRAEVEAKIASTFNRAKIGDQYGVRKTYKGDVDYYRAYHNGYGRQEGKRVGGCIVTKIG